MDRAQIQNIIRSALFWWELPKEEIESLLKDPQIKEHLAEALEGNNNVELWLDSISQDLKDSKVSIDKTAWQSCFDELIIPAVSEKTKLSFTPQEISEYPFGEYFAVFADLLMNRSVQTSSLHTKYISRESTLSLSLQIVQELSRLFARVLLADFKDFQNHVLQLTSVPEAGPNKKDGLYSLYMESLIGEQNGLLIFNRYPVFARLLSERMRQIGEVLAEFLLHLDCDLENLVEGIDEGNPVNLSSLQLFDTSDPHNDGRQVIFVTINGKKMVYKPHCLGSEEAWSKVVGLLEQEKVVSAQLIPQFIPHPDKGYHWAEFISQILPETSEVKEELYIKTGEILFVLYLLGGTDFHHENILVHRSFPVPIDFETVCSYEVSSQKESNEDFFLWDSASCSVKVINKSVLRVGILPCWNRAKTAHNNPLPETSWHPEFLCSIGRPPLSQDRLEWHNLKTDQMGYKYNSNHSFSTPAKMEVDEKACDQIIKGFNNAYLKFLAKKEQLAGPVTDLIKCCAMRFIYRPTRVYLKLLERLGEPYFLLNGLVWSVELERLALSHLSSSSPSKASTWPIREHEVRSMAMLSVPYFSFKALENPAVQLGIERRINFLSPVEALRRRIDQLNVEDATLQIKIIQSSLNPLFINSLKDISVSDNNLTNRSTEKQCKEGTREVLINLRDFIWNQRVKTQDHELSWIEFRDLNPIHKTINKPQDLSWYDGSTGVCLFLAMSNEIRTSDELNSGLKKWLETMEKTFSLFPKALEYSKRQGSGSFFRLLYYTSIIKQLTGCGSFNQSIAELQNRILSWPIEIFKLGSFSDYILGTAGTLEFWKERFGSLPLSLQQFLKEETIKGGQKSIAAKDKDFGVAHGLAGFILGLTAVNNFLNQKEQYALRNLEGNLKKYCKKFLDRGIDPVHNPGGWCRGIIGMIPVLSIMGEHGLADALTKQITHSIQNCTNIPFTEWLSLCCGYAGFVEIYSNVLPRMGLRAHNEIDQVLSLNLGQIITQLISHPRELWSPSLMTGLSGLGLVLANRLRAEPLGVLYQTTHLSRRLAS